MTATLIPFPVFRAFDSDGAPLSGGLLYTYQAGTSTPLATYTDQSGNTANTNPVVLDSTGSANVWLSDASYKMVLKDADSVIQWTVDNVQSVQALINTATSVLSADLANTSDVSKGDALIGVKQPLTNSAPRTQHDKNLDIINVHDFGANPTKSASDNAASFQAAINSLSSGIIYIPAGTYDIGSSLTMKSSVSLVGEGPASKLVPSSAVTTDFIVGSSIEKTNLKDFYIDCSSMPTPGGSAISINGISDSEISGLYIYNSAWFGWLIFGAVRCKFLRNTINKTRKWDGMTISSGSVNNVISNNIVIDSYDSGIGFTDTLGTTCVGNYVSRSKVDGNWFAPGIDASGAKNAVITGNYVEGNQFGISILQHPNSGSQPKRIAITGNTIADGSIGVMCDSVTLVPPAVSEDTPRDGIVISGNTIFSQGTAGVIVNGAFNPSIQANNISNSATGVSAVNNTGIAIIGNDFNVCDIGVNLNTDGNSNTSVCFNVLESCTTSITGSKGSGTSYFVHNKNGGSGLGNVDHEAFAAEWDFGGQLRLSGYHLWVDAAGRLRITNGQPANATDGTIVGTQS